MEFIHSTIHALYCYNRDSAVYWISGSIPTCFLMLCYGLVQCLWHQYNAYLIGELYWDDTSSLYSHLYMCGLCTHQDSVDLHHQTHYKPKWRNAFLLLYFKVCGGSVFMDFIGIPHPQIYILKDLWNPVSTCIYSFTSTSHFTKLGLHDSVKKLAIYNNWTPPPITIDFISFFEFFCFETYTGK